jgi:hypothetical protein
LPPPPPPSQDETVRNLIWEEIKDMHLGEGEGDAVDPPPPVATKGEGRKEGGEGWKVEEGRKEGEGMKEGR